MLNLYDILAGDINYPCETEDIILAQINQAGMLCGTRIA